jgi:hypothetical protein
VGLTKLVRFLVIELTHPDSNSRFDMCVVFTDNYYFSRRRRPRRQRCTIGDRLHESQDQSQLILLNVLIKIVCTYIYSYELSVSQTKIL